MIATAALLTSQPSNTTDEYILINFSSRTLIWIDLSNGKMIDLVLASFAVQGSGRGRELWPEVGDGVKG